MGFLDQVFDDDEQFEQIGPEGVVNASSLLASNQAMRDGFRSGDGIDTTFDLPEFSNTGTVNASEALNQAFDYKELIIHKQLQPLRFRDTADDVFVGGIKDGGNVVIRIVDEKKTQGSWKDLARYELQKEHKTLLFDKFSVMNVMEPDQERYQIVETFGTNLIYGFGRRPRMLRFQGQILNGEMRVKHGSEVFSMDWANAFKRKYEDQYRLTKCIEDRKKIMIHAQDTIYTGYFLTMNVNTTAMEQGAANVVISCILDEKSYPEHNDENLPGDFTSSGARVGGAELPKDLLPEAKIDSFIRDNVIGPIEEKVNEFKNERNLFLYKYLENEHSGISRVSDEVIDRLDEFGEDDFVTILGGDVKLHTFIFEDTDGKIQPDNSKWDVLKRAGEQTKALNLKRGLVKRTERANEWIQKAIRFHEKAKEYQDKLDRTEKIKSS